jgi:hypothetical protein
MDREQVHQNTCQLLRRPTPIGLRTERDHLYANRTPGIGTLLIGATKYCKYTDSLAHCRPQTIGEGLVTLNRMTKPEEIRARALMPNNSEACWSGAPFSYY